MTDDELRGMLEKATKGPWESAKMKHNFIIHPHTTKPGYQGRLADVVYWDPNHTGNSKNPLRDDAAANARLIALAPTLAVRVLADAEKIARLTEALEFYEREWVPAGTMKTIADAIMVYTDRPEPTALLNADGGNRARAALASIDEAAS